MLKRLFSIEFTLFLCLEVRVFFYKHSKIGLAANKIRRSERSDKLSGGTRCYACSVFVEVCRVRCLCVNGRAGLFAADAGNLAA